jgi:hypothetical protein
VTAVEAYELTSHRGSTALARLIAACESFGPYCLIGGWAVNCCVEPVYTLDAGIVMIAASLPELTAHLDAHGFNTDLHERSLNAVAPRSELRIQFTAGERYRTFPARSVEATVLAVRVDELDPIRFAEAYPKLRVLYPSQLREQLEHR